MTYLSLVDYVPLHWYNSLSEDHGCGYVFPESLPYLTDKQLPQSIGSWLYKPENYDDPVAELFKLQQLVLPYNTAALSSSVRDGPLRRCEGAYSALGASDFEVVMIWVSLLVVPTYHECILKPLS